MVSASPEPPNARSAGARCGAPETFAPGGIETPLNSPGTKKAAFRLLLTSPAVCSGRLAATKSSPCGDRGARQDCLRAGGGGGICCQCNRLQQRTNTVIRI